MLYAMVFFFKMKGNENDLLFHKFTIQL